MLGQYAANLLLEARNGGDPSYPPLAALHRGQFWVI